MSRAILYFWKFYVGQVFLWHCHGALSIYVFKLKRLFSNWIKYFFRRKKKNGTSNQFWRGEKAIWPIFVWLLQSLLSQQDLLRFRVFFMRALLGNSGMFLSINYVWICRGIDVRGRSMPLIQRAIYCFFTACFSTLWRLSPASMSTFRIA